MRRFLTLLLLALLLLTIAAVQAADLEVHITCAEPSDDGLHVWFGYSASEAGTNTMISYIDDGPAVYMDEVQAGDHERVADALFSSSEDAIMFSIGAWFGDDFQYRELWVDHDTAAPDCPAAGESTPALKTVTIWDVTGWLFTWEIRDGFGNWSSVGVTTPVEYDGDRPFTRLVLGADNPDDNPTDYRVTSVG